MTGVENVTEPHSLRPNTLRVRRHRQRRREGLRLLTVEIPEPVIEAAIARGLLKPEDCAQSSSVMRSAFATQLSDTALNWLTSNAVITSEQRADAVAILQRISEWLERAAARARKCWARPLLIFSRCCSSSACLLSVGLHGLTQRRKNTLPDFIPVEIDPP
jgi:hypothetical protein